MKTTISDLICTSLGLLLTAVASAQSNDHFANRMVVTGTSFSSTPVAVDNATMQVADPDIGRGAKNVWYSWTAPSDLKMSLNTTGSTVGYLTIYVNIGDDFGTLNRISAGGVVNFTAVKGMTYQISVVVGYNHNGTVILNGTSSPFASGVPVLGPDVPNSASPRNDNFAGRKVLPAAPLVAVGYHTTATREPNERGEAGNQTLWYSYTPTESKVLSINPEGSSGYVRVAVYQGGALDRLTYLGSGRAIRIVSGITYQIAVGFEYTNADQVSILNLSLAELPSSGTLVGPEAPTSQSPKNDLFVNRQRLSGNRVSVIGNTYDASRESFEPAHGEYSIWYSWITNQGGTLRLAASEDYSYLNITVYTGTEIGSLVKVGGGIGPSCNVAVQGGVEYQIAVSTGSYNARGPITLDIAGPGFARSTATGDLARLTNIATRGLVGTGGDILVGGFTLSSTRTVLIRAVGPTLGSFGVSNALIDPKMDLFQGNTLITSNDNWGNNGDAAQISNTAAGVGAFALVANSKDAAIISTLPAGGYTVQVAGVGGTTGVAIIEVYEVP